MVISKALIIRNSKEKSVLHIILNGNLKIIFKIKFAYVTNDTATSTVTVSRECH
jgi:hypothetical protein